MHEESEEMADLDHEDYNAFIVDAINKVFSTLNNREANDDRRYTWSPPACPYEADEDDVSEEICVRVRGG